MQACIANVAEPGTISLRKSTVLPLQEEPPQLLLWRTGWMLARVGEARTQTSFSLAPHLQFPLLTAGGVVTVRRHHRAEGQDFLHC